MALKLGEVLNNLVKEETSRLIAEVVLEADTNTVTIPNLDINRDGRVYDFDYMVKIGPETSGSGRYPQMRVNTISASNYCGISKFCTAELSSSGQIPSANFYPYYYQNVDSMFIAAAGSVDGIYHITGSLRLLDGVMYLKFKSCSINLPQTVQRDFEGWFIYNSTIDNITSIQVIVSNTTMQVGSVFRIYKR